jgi:lipoprotein-anchoring transpeptidase ErfK/SrfK
MNREVCKTLNGIPKKLTVAVLVIVFAVPLLAQDSTPNTDDNEDDDSGSRVVLVSLVDRQLAVIQDGEVIATFQVAVGADVTPSPTGEFKLVSRVENPTYYHPRVVIPAGKDNPLGTRWLGLSQKGYGIHGTNAPKSIGHAASHGCIRLRNRDVERLFTLVNVGDTVKIRAERDDETARIFGDQTDDTLVASAPSATVPAGQ